MGCLIAALVLGLVAHATPGFASDPTSGQTRHYLPKPSETLEEAVRNFAIYTGKVEAILAKSDLSEVEMEQVHEITYTLEMALAKINADLAELPDTLERLHLASEGEDVARFTQAAEAYLAVAGAFAD